MNVYLAASFDQQSRMREYAAQLGALNIRVTSRWIRGEHEITDGELEQHPALAHRYANDDRLDVMASDIFVMFTNLPSTRGGRHVEFGIAVGSRYGARIETWVVGKRENVFQYWEEVKLFETWEDALAELTRRKVKER